MELNNDSFKAIFYENDVKTTHSRLIAGGVGMLDKVEWHFTGPGKGLFCTLPAPCVG